MGVFFRFVLLEVHWDSWIYKFMFSSNEKFSSMISSNIISSLFSISLFLLDSQNAYINPPILSHKSFKLFAFLYSIWSSDLMIAKDLYSSLLVFFCLSILLNLSNEFFNSNILFFNPRISASSSLEFIFFCWHSNFLHLSFSWFP